MIWLIESYKKNVNPIKSCFLNKLQKKSLLLFSSSLNDTCACVYWVQMVAFNTAKT